MTQQKSLKRRVRARMTKTGERYTAARRQLLTHGGEPALPEATSAQALAAETTPPGMAPGGMPSPATTPADTAPAETLAPVPDSPFRGSQGASDAVLVLRTGEPWEHWYRLLEAWGAADRPHADIARWLNREQGVDGWWAQELTVRYEMAIGRRKPGQRPDGFEATASKTVNVPVERLYAAFVDDDERARWLGRSLRFRTGMKHRTARFDWEDGTQRVVVGFIAKGGRSNVAIAHQRLPDAAGATAMKAFWRDALANLARHLEGAD
jgi:hypothetical protein